MIKLKSNNGRVNLVKRHDMALICGDGRTLPQELQMFRQFGLKHDAFCVGRSLQCYIPYVSWAPAVVNYIWLDEQMFTYARDQVEDYIICHSVFFDAKLQPAIDVLWSHENGDEITSWDGSSGLFATMVAITMGYDKILLCGMPLNAEHHWYDDPSVPGPQWTPETLRAWGKFAAELNGKITKFDRIRSCSGYTQYLFGVPKVGWLQGKNKAH